MITREVAGKLVLGRTQRIKLCSWKDNKIVELQDRVVWFSLSLHHNIYFLLKLLKGVL